MQPKGRKHISATIFAAAGIALAAGGLVQPAVSHAEKIWDIGSYDRCVRTADDRYLSGQTDSATHSDEIKFCCNRSGGEWSQTQGCTAPAPVNAQGTPEPPAPGSLGVPGTVHTRPGNVSTLP